MFDLTNHEELDVFHAPLKPYTGDDVPLYWHYANGVAIPIMTDSIESKEKSLEVSREA